MKTCPNCKMTTDSTCECPVCKTSLASEEFFEGKGEIYKLNKFFLPFFIKKCWFFSLCCALILLKTLFLGISFNARILISALFLVLCLVQALFPERLNRLFKWKYSEEYLQSTSNIVVYVSGICAFLSAFLW